MRKTRSMQLFGLKYLAFRCTIKRFCSETANHLKCLRNIGIIAHVDAGKTTTTERMLFYSGVTRIMGEVHDGDTVMDYMSLERERGITITSASITFAWKKNRINLIDTPGHVDFTIEVERSLSVLDGAVAILDASAGVEAQTYTVWSQSNRYRVPRIIYLNKMDKQVANMYSCVKSVEQKLNVKPLPIHVPIGESKGFSGVVDVVTMQKHIWDQNDSSEGQNFLTVALDATDTGLYDRATKMREELIGTLSELDDQIASEVLANDKLENISVQSVQNAIRRATIEQLGFPILCGSSYRNVGVQLLLDSIIRYLPSPLENVRNLVKLYGKHLCAYAFKIIFDKRLGLLTFLRIYSGEIKPQQYIYNATQNKKEKIGKIYTAFSNEYKEQTLISNGNIAVVTGLTDTNTGDTLAASFDIAEKVKKTFKSKYSKESENSKPTFANIKVPEPVFYCTIESPSLSKLSQFELALENLQKEDPSFKVSTDKETGQTVIKGMGELHIETIKDRILKEYNVDAYVGQLQVSYRETITQRAEQTFIISKAISGITNNIKITLAIRPTPNQPFEKLKIIVTKENSLENLRADYLKAIEMGISNAFQCGPLLFFPVINVAVDLLWFEITRGTTQPFIISSVYNSILNLIKNASPVLLEPFMKVEITCQEKHFGPILTDLSQRRSIICNSETRGGLTVVNAFTPLSQLINYSNALRTLTSGTSVFTIEFDSYHQMSDTDMQNVIRQ